MGGLKSVSGEPQTVSRSILRPTGGHWWSTLERPQEASIITREISSGLTTAASEDPTLWAPLWDMLGTPCLREQGRALIVRLSLTAACSWALRFTKKFNGFPYKLLWMVEKPSGTTDPQRKIIAKTLLDTPDCCLKSNSDDVAFKIKHFFANDLRSVAEDGTCPNNLFKALLLYRAGLPIDMQEVEGCNSIIKVMSQRAPYMKLPLASVRLSLKKGKPLKAEQCVNMHHRTLELMDSEDQVVRFGPLPLTNAPADVPKHEYCPHEYSEPTVFAVAYALSAARQLEPDVRAVYTVGGPQPVSFVLPWRYGKNDCGLRVGGLSQLEASKHFT